MTLRDSNILRSLNIKPAAHTKNNLISLFIKKKAPITKGRIRDDTSARIHCTAFLLFEYLTNIDHFINIILLLDGFVTGVC